MEIRIPSYLTKRSQCWIRQTLAAMNFTAGEAELLIQGAEALDRCQQARRSIKRSGLVYVNRYNHPIARPEIAIERDSRNTFARICKSLKITEVPNVAKR